LSQPKRESVEQDGVQRFSLECDRTVETVIVGDCPIPRTQIGDQQNREQKQPFIVKSSL
jgi:hypothetical protein